MSKPWSDSTKRAVAIGLVLILLLLIYRFSAIIAPLVIAVIVAYILTPVVDALNQRTRIPRSLCVWLVDVLALASLAIIPVVVAPVLISELTAVNVDTQALASKLESYLGGRVILLGFRVNLGDVYQQVATSLQALISPLISQGVFFLLDVARGILWTIFVFVVSFYLMRDWHKIAKHIESVVPPNYKLDYANLMMRMGQIWQSFFRGQVVLSLVVGTVSGLTMAIVGVSNAFVLGLLAGLLEVIPNFGPVIAAIPAVILALLKGSSWLPLGNFWFALLVAGLYVLIQQVENNYLVPRIIGGSVKLHPMVVLVGAIAGARLAGVLGIFLAAPVLASGRVLLAYVYGKLLDQEPFPEPLEPLAAAKEVTSAAGERGQVSLVPIIQRVKRNLSRK
ncbi:MAG: AI-2E family transporter [Anaerolineae bacterium]